MHRKSAPHNALSPFPVRNRPTPLHSTRTAPFPFRYLRTVHIFFPSNNTQTRLSFWVFSSLQASLKFTVEQWIDGWMVEQWMDRKLKHKSMNCSRDKTVYCYTVTFKTTEIPKLLVISTHKKKRFHKKYSRIRKFNVKNEDTLSKY